MNMMCVTHEHDVVLDRRHRVSLFVNTFSFFLVLEWCFCSWLHLVFIITRHRVSYHTCAGEVHLSRTCSPAGEVHLSRTCMMYDLFISIRWCATDVMQCLTWMRRIAPLYCNTQQDNVRHCIMLPRVATDAYRVAKTHRIPYLYSSFSAKITYI